MNHYPNWQLRITDIVSHCTGEDIFGDFTIRHAQDIEEERSP